MLLAACDRSTQRIQRPDPTVEETPSAPSLPSFNGPSFTEVPAVPAGCGELGEVCCFEGEACFGGLVCSADNLCQMPIVPTVDDGGTAPTDDGGQPDGGEEVCDDRHDGKHDDKDFKKCKHKPKS